MKKMISVLMILCLFLAAAAALAEGTPTLESMPKAVEETDIAKFDGTWEPSANIFTDGAYAELEQVINAFNPPKILIGDGVIFFDDIDDDGNAAAIELTGTPDAGKLTAEYKGDQMVFQLLEDGNIRLDKIIEDDNDTVTITVFYVRDEHIDED